MVLSADRIVFYSNRFVMRADGHVRLDLGTGSIVQGSSFIMDVHNDRFVVAGDVRVTGRDAAFDAVALAEDLANDRAYAITVADGAPQRIAFRRADLRGSRVPFDAPATAFDIPDVTDVPASYVARNATIGADSYIRLSGCRTQILGGTKLYFPLPSCYIGFGSDPNLAQNSLSGANVGAGYEFTGNANAISSVLINYDTTNGVYGAVQQNISGPNAWAVASINPLGHKDLVYSAIGSVQLDDSTGLRVSGQYHTLTPTLESPDGSYSYYDALVTQALPYAYASLYATSGNQGVAAGSSAIPVQQSSLSLNLASSDIALGRSPLVLNVSGGYGQEHDPYGLQTFGGVTYATIWNENAGIELRAPHLALGDPAKPQSQWYLDLAAGIERQWNSLPHVITETTTAASLSRSFDKASFYASYLIQNVGDDYGSAQSSAYPVMPSVDPGYAAFDGFATFRTLALEGAYTPRADFVITATLRQHFDFPKPYAGFFVPLAAPALGQNPLPFALGEPPYDASLAARYRINPQLSIELDNTYYFNFGGRTWSGLNFQIRP